MVLNLMKGTRAAVLLVGFLLYGYGCGQSSSLFQCRSSSDQSGLVYTPNIPDFYFNDVNAADFISGREAKLTATDDGTTYIFTIPPESLERNCSGDVVAIQYCYEARDRDIGMNSSVFNLLHLNRNGLDFRVDSSFAIYTTPQEEFCSDPPGPGMDAVCCDTATLDRFQIPSTSFTFAVMVINNDVRPLAFAESANDFRHNQLQAFLGISALSPEFTFSLGQSEVVTDESLLLLRFLVAPFDIAPDVSNAPSSTPGPTPPSPPPSPDSSNTAPPSTPDPNNTTEPSTDPSYTTEPSTEPRNITEPSDPRETETAVPPDDCSPGSLGCTAPPTVHLDTEGPTDDEDYGVAGPLTTTHLGSGEVEVTLTPSETSVAIEPRNTVIIISVAVGIGLVIFVMATSIILLAKRCTRKKHGNRIDRYHRSSVQVGGAEGNALPGNHVAEKGGEFGPCSNSESLIPKVDNKTYPTNMAEAEYDYIDDSEGTVTTETSNSDQGMATDVAPTSGKHVAKSDYRFGNALCVAATTINGDAEYDYIDDSDVIFTELADVPKEGYLLHSNSNFICRSSTPGENIGKNNDPLQLHSNRFNGSDGDIEYDYVDDTSVAIITETVPKEEVLTSLPHGNSYQIRRSPIVPPTDETVDNLLGLYSNGLYGSSVFGVGVMHVTTTSDGDREYDYIDDTKCTAVTFTDNCSNYPCEASTVTRSCTINIPKEDSADMLNRVVVSPNPAYGISIDGT